MRRIALFVLPLITLFPLSADALTVRDVVELTRAGLGEDIILALIEVDPSVFPIDTATLKTLKDAGVSQRVIVAMIRSGRAQPPPADPLPAVIEEARAPEPQVIVIDHHDAQVQQVPVPVPVYVPFAVTNNHRGIVDDLRHVADPYDAARRLEVRQGVRLDSVTDVGRTPSQPVYWGFGGHLRPDAWQPTPVRKDKER
jgi:hypothetical protein